jgi:uncharacterized protein (TIGR02118 family)
MMEEWLMVKNLGLIPRRPDLTRQAFREYYERRHAPLALKHLRCFRRYVRNHVVASTPAEPSFDALSEFWYDSAADVDAVIAILNSPAGAVLRDDEAQFMDRAGIRIVRVQESLLFGPARSTEDGVVTKHALLLHRAAGAHAADFQGDVQRACAALLSPRESAFVRLQLDLPTDPDEPGLALDALLTAWPDADGRAPFDALPELASVAEMTRLRFESLETPPQLLRD